MSVARDKDLLRNFGFSLPIVAMLLLLLPTQDAFAGCPGGRNRSDISVTTEVVDFDPAGNPYTISSDGRGSYFNGVDGVTSIFTANTYNCVPTGDWQFNKPFLVKGKTAYSNRRMGVSLNPSDAVQPGDPHFTVAATPPFWGTQVLRAYAEVKCSYVNVSMMTIAANTAVTCPTLFAFFTATDERYALSPGYSYFQYPEITDAQVSCNAADSAGCKDWYIEPIGSLQAVARLVLEGGATHGDFYMRFKFHITRP